MSPEPVLPADAVRRVDIKTILADPAQHQALIDGAVRFLCEMEGHQHKAQNQGSR